MDTNWFDRSGWLYRPVHPAGYIVTIAAIIFMIPITIACYMSTHSVTDFFYDFFVYVTCTFFWWNWIATRTCNPSS